MALLEKIFITNGKLSYGFRNSRIGSRSREAELEQVRLLLYKECERRGRKVLFDSSTIERLPANKNDKPECTDTNKFPYIVEVVDGFTYLYKGPASDAGMLGEMIFGAVAMNYKSVSLKIHIMEEPKRLMCTKMFFVPTRRISRRERKTDVNANVMSEMRSCSKPLNVPMREEGVSLSFSIDRGDSGFYSDHSYSTIGSNIDFYSMLDSWDGNINMESSFTSSPSKYSSSSCGSWQRRSFQSMSTKFDLTSTSLRVPTTGTVSSSDSQMYSNSVSGTCESFASSSSVASRRTKLGLALLITVAETADMDVIRRCVEHSNQLQSLVCRLRLATLRAAAPGKFVATLHKATEDAAVWLSDLMFGSRLQPVWLSLVTSERRQANKIAENLLADLCSVISVGDTKNTNFFISTLLTQVLTHHLGWVTTVSPYDCIDPTNLPEKENSRRNYNALWAQLGDLCGSIGYPPRIAKTIVSGTTNRQFINRLLNILTYFMRCGDVKRNDFTFQDCAQSESKVTCVKKPESSIMPCLEVCSVNNSNGSGSVRDTTHIVSSANRSTLNGDVGLKKSTTVTNLDRKLSNSEFNVDASSCRADTRGGPMRRNPSIMISSLRENSSPDSSDSSQKSSVADPSEAEKKVLFVLGDDEKLVGLKNKSSGGKSVKKSSKVHNEPINLEATVTEKEKYKEECSESCDRDQPNGNSSVKCCSQTLEHSKPIKHSGFKFEFDKYPQIVTNYMKSKNLEILDRHYIGKPGNLKLDNFQFDPTVVPQIQEERCETCYKCQMMESLLQTPTNASEMEYLNDFPRQVEPQYAKETMVDLSNKHRELSPKTFVRKRKENTVIVDARMNAKEIKELEEIRKKNIVDVKEVIEFPLPRINLKPVLQVRSGFDASLLGGVTDHYVPDLILQGTLASPKLWEGDLRRDLDLTLYLNKTQDAPAQAVAIIGDTDKWEVRVVGGGAAGGGLSPLVGGLLDALPAMRRARVPAHQCLLYVESKLREFCVLSKTLADMLMSTDFCNITTLTKSLNIDVNDVPLLLAVASTHTPQVAARYGISYR